MLVIIVATPSRTGGTRWCRVERSWKQTKPRKRGELDESKLFHEFRIEVGEMNNFVAEKRKKSVKERYWRERKKPMLGS